MKINTLFRQICGKSPGNLIGIFRSGNSGSGWDIFAGNRVNCFRIAAGQMNGIYRYRIIGREVGHSWPVIMI